jgi:quinol monooxygenase YgiN
MLLLALQVPRRGLYDHGAEGTPKNTAPGHLLSREHADRRDDSTSPDPSDFRSGSVFDYGFPGFERASAAASMQLIANESSEGRAVGEIQGVGRFKLDEDTLAEFKRLSSQCMEIVRAKDTGTLQYEVYLSDDESEAIVLERYRDSDALMEHAANLGELGQAVLATGLVSSQLLGEPSAELRGMLAGGPARLFRPFLSM